MLPLDEVPPAGAADEEDSDAVAERVGLAGFRRDVGDGSADGIAEVDVSGEQVAQVGLLASSKSAMKTLAPS